ncbi:MAG: class I SAM-dependent methyltransferase [Gemmataceae bacterium]
MNKRVNWQLPTGVNRGLWDYVHNADLAQNYDAYLAESTLPQVDLDFVIRHLPRPGRLIDLGCGTGRLLIPLARRGFWCLGVDLSEEMLRIVAEKADAAGVTVPRVRANIVELEALADASFDYAACLFSTLGMIAGPEARCRALAQVYRLLRPGGQFLLHVHNRWFNVWNANGRKWLLYDSIRSVTCRPSAGDMVMPIHQGVAGLTLHLFTRREIVRLLQQTGFHVLEVQSVSLRPDGRLPYSWWFGGLRSYGYLLAAEKKSENRESLLGPLLRSTP